MIGILIGIGAILLGAKGFTRDGLPLTSSKRLTGTGAKVAGVICLLIGLAFIAEGLFSIYVISQRRS
jgi:hypothetical protein